MKYAIIAALLVALMQDRLMGADEVASRQVPLLVEGGMIQVPVTAFGQTLYFIVDTGFTVSALDLKYQAYLGQPVDTYAAASPLGTKNVPVYECPEMAIAGKPLGLDKILGLDLQMIRMITGHPCDGVLGMDWFAKNVVSLNFDNHTFSISEETPPEVRNTFVAETLEQSNGYGAMKVVLNQDIPLDLMIDTGDSSSLSLSQAAWQQVFSTNAMMTAVATVADAVNQVAQTKIGVVASLTCQDLGYTNLHAMFIANPGLPSRLGLGFFQRHNVTFDFPGGMIYLQPDHDFSAPDIEDMSGLHLLRDGTSTFVYSVDTNSPAFTQGIMANDVIEMVNDQPAASLTMNTIRQMLHSGEGNRVNLQVRRGDMLLNVSLVLRNQFETAGKLRALANHSKFAKRNPKAWGFAERPPGG